MPRAPSLLLCSLGLIALPGAAQAQNTTALIAGVFTPARAAPDFTIDGSDGAPLSLSHYRGKVVLLSFGYTRCTEVCPVTLAVLATAHQRLGERGRDVQVIYVTVDPERDDVARMRVFVRGFDPSFIGGTGSPAQLASVRQNYGISATRIHTADGYMMSHTSYVYLIDRRGALRALMPFGHSPDDYVHDLDILLRQ